MQRQVQNQYTQQLATASEEIATLNRTLFQSTILQDEKALNAQLLSIHESSGKVKNALSAIPILQDEAGDWIHYMSEIESLAGNTIQDGNYKDWQEQSPALAKQFYELDEEWNVLTTNYFQHVSSLDDYIASTTDFDNLSTRIKTFNEQSFPVTASESDYEKKKQLKQVDSKPITKQQAQEKFYTLFPELKDAKLTVSINKDDAPYEFYHIQFVRGSRIGYVDLLKNGGHLLSVLIDRPVLDQGVSQQEAREQAEQFLQRNSMKDATYVEVRENHEAWHFVFARTVDGVVIYPDAVQLKVAKDNGEVIGVSALEYIQAEKLPAIENTKIDWEEFLSPIAKVEESKLVIIEDEHYELRLCHEALVTSSQDPYHTYRLFIDAKSKTVEKIELIN